MILPPGLSSMVLLWSRSLRPLSGPIPTPSCYLKDVFAHEASFASASLGISGSGPSRSASVSLGPLVSKLVNFVFSSSPFILGVCAILHYKGRQSR